VVDILPTPPPASRCQVAGEHVTALVLWGPRWRPDQKDVPLREAAAESGIEEFFANSGCFVLANVRRVPLEAPITKIGLKELIAESSPMPDRVLTIAVRELGPIVKLLSSLALVEGGTDVLLEISAYDSANLDSRADFTVHWQNGGPWVLKGTGTLPHDIQAALAAALKPRSGAQVSGRPNGG